MIEAGGAPNSPGAGTGEQPGEAVERLAERRPVVEVGGRGAASRLSGPPAAPQAPRGDRLPPALGVVQRGREHERVRGADQQVVEVAREVLLEPVPLAPR